MILKKIVFVVFLLCSLAIFSQVEVSGKIVDTQNQPIAFANVLFKNSTQGVYTDDDGNFLLESDKNYTHIIISFVGFKNKEIKLSSRIMRDLRITLEEDAATLDEVEIVSKPKKRLKKKENPAYKILKKIWENKRKNGLDIVNQYKYKQYKATEFGVNNINTKLMKRVFKNSYDSIATMVDKFKKGDNFYVPLFLTEEMAEVYGDNKLYKTRKITLGTKKTGVQQQEGFVLDMLQNIFASIDISKPNIVLFNKPFLNPLANNGFSVYDYVLKDSVTVNNRKQYKIYFFPREEGDLAFLGNFVVDAENYFIKNISLNTDKKANLNLIRSLIIEKSFSLSNDSLYVPLQDYFEADITGFTKKDEERGAMIKETRIYKDYTFNDQKETTFYTKPEVVYNPTVLEKGEEYWEKVRLEGTKQNAYSSTIIKSVKNAGRVKRVTNILSTLITGYIPLGNSLEYGSIYSTLGNNNIEGWRLRGGLQTFKSQHDRFLASAYLAYGFKDEAFKYGGNMAYVLSYKPRFTAAVSYYKDIEQLGAQLLNPQGLFAGSFGSQSLANRGTNYFLSDVIKYSGSFGYEPTDNLMFSVSGEYRNIESAAPRDKFTIDYIDAKGNLQSKVKDATLGLSVRYTPGRVVMGHGIRRRFGNDLHPTFILSYKKSIEGVYNSTFNYDKLQFYYNHPIVVSNLGVLDATVEFGKTFGEVPLSLLSVVPGNQSFTVSRNTFSLMNYYEFVTDTYASGHFLYRFNGVIMNRIPLIKKLKLRSLLLFRGAWGTISDKNIAINRATANNLPLTYNAPKDKLYYEYGFGIENIGIANMRIFRFDFLWRGSYLNNPGFDVPKFGVRMGIRPGF